MTLNGQPVDVFSVLSHTPQDAAFAVYNLCNPSADGHGVASFKSVSGWSVETVIKAAGAAPGLTTSFSVKRARGRGRVDLLPADFDPATPGGIDFPDGPALVTNTFGFFRPERTAPCPADINGLDQVQPALGASLEIRITTGAVAHVTASADPTSTTTGTAVHFSATVDDPPVVGETFTTTWSFTDDTTATGADVTHTFDHTGTFNAVATVVGNKQSGGSSEPVVVTVGTAPGAPGGGTTSPTAPPGRGGTTGPTTGTHPTAPPTTTASSSPTRPVSRTPTSTSTSGGRSTAPVVSTASPTTTSRPTPANSATPLPTATTTAGVGDQEVAGVLVGSLSQGGLADLAVRPVVAVGPHGTVRPALQIGERVWAGLAAILCLLLGVLLESGLLRRLSRPSSRRRSSS